MNLPDAVLRYAAHPDGLIDVHLPVALGDTPCPLVVLVHGGFWRARYDRRHTRPLAAALAAEGAVVATPEYRRVGGEGPATGGWPTTLEDVSAAMTALPDLLAGLDVTTTTTTLVGHSAGGHLVLWLANEPHRIDRVVGLAPVGDLRAAARHQLGRGATQAFLGGGPADVPERYAAADPATRLTTRPAAQVVILHGTADDEVPVANARGLVERHPYLELVELEDVDHYALITPGSEAWPAVRDAVLGAEPGAGTTG